MVSKTVIFVCVLAMFNNAYSQVLNRLVPNVLPLGENLLSNQLLLNSGNLIQLSPNVVGPNVVPIAPNVVPVAPNVVNYEVPACGVDAILSSPVTTPTTTIIQDSSVANNLANALQLLVVSNLLSSTLPSMGSDLLLSSYSSPVELVSPVSLGGLGGYNLVY